MRAPLGLVPDRAPRAGEVNKSVASQSRFRSGGEPSIRRESTRRRGFFVANSGKKNNALPIYVLNGPSLNLLGTREPEIYGSTTLAEIGKMTSARAATHGLTTVFRQSNHEGEIIDWIQEARTKTCGMILNGAAFTHTSVAIYDALKVLEKPLIEVHLSNPYARETFRHHSYVSRVAKGVICGLGAFGYLAAVDALAHIIKGQPA